MSKNFMQHRELALPPGWYRSPDGRVLLNLAFVMCVTLDTHGTQAVPSGPLFLVRSHLSYGDWIPVFSSGDRAECEKVMDEIGLIVGAALIARKT